MKGLIVVILLVMLLSLARKSSYGQGAWILWGKTTVFSLKDRKTEKSWEFSDAYPTYESCVRAKVDRCLAGVKYWKGVEAISLQELEEFKKKQVEKRGGLEPGDLREANIISVWGIYGEDPHASYCEEYTVTGFPQREKQVTYQFQCFPETFDPRK